MKDTITKGYNRKDKRAIYYFFKTEKNGYYINFKYITKRILLYREILLYRVFAILL